MWIEVGFMTLGQRSGVLLCKQQSFHFLTIYTGRYVPKVYPLVFHSDFAFQHLWKDTWDMSCHDITQCHQCHRDVISTRCELTTALEWLSFSSTVCSWGTRKSQDARPRWLSIQEDTQSQQRFQWRHTEEHVNIHIISTLNHEGCKSLHTFSGEK